MNATPHLVLPPELSSPRRAREFAINGIGSDDGLCDTVALLVSEVASNAVLHARTSFQVRLHADDTAKRILAPPPRRSLWKRLLRLFGRR